MQIVGNGDWCYLQDALQMLDGLFEKAIALRILEIPYMLREKGVPAVGQADGVLQFTTNGQHRWHILAQENRNRHKPARAPQLSRPPAGDPRHGVVAAQQNVAVVKEEAVGQLAQPANCLIIGNAYRLLAQVGTSHDQRCEATSSKKQMMERRVWKEHAKVAVERRNFLRDRSIFPVPQQGNGPLRAEQQLARSTVHFAKTLRRIKVGNHHRKWLFNSTLALAELPHRVG